MLDLFGLGFRVDDRGLVSDGESQAADHLVKSAADRLAVIGVEVTTVVTEGFPPTNIVDYADRWPADFIIVGSHGHSGISRFLLGSVAQGVLRAAHCSVEIVRPRSNEERRGRRILLATDGSDYSGAAGRSVASRPWPEGSEVKVITSVSVILAAADTWYYGGEVPVQLLEEHTKYAHEYVEAGKRLLRESGLKTTGTVLTGGAKRSIVNEAKGWGADLVVLGSQGAGSVGRFWEASQKPLRCTHPAPSTESALRTANAGSKNRCCR